MPVEGSDEHKRTNEIGMAIVLLKTCNIAGRDITGDALLTQRALAAYIVGQQAHYHFTVKGNQPMLERDIALLFDNRAAPDFTEVTPPDHGRIETRRIWCSTALNAYLDFPHVGQVFLIERETVEKKTGTCSREIALGITSRTREQASQPYGLRAPPYRLRPGEHNAPAPLRSRHPEVLPATRPINCSNDAQALLP